VPSSQGKVAELSPAKRALLERLRKSAAASTGIRRRDPNRPAPLSFAQQRLWLVHQLDPESYLFNVPRGLRLCGELDVAKLEASLNEIVRRHEVLRTVFAGDSGELHQVVTAQTPIRLIASEIAPDHLLEAATDEFRQPFDLSTGPVLRARLWQLAEREHVLLIVLHHVVSDAWTASILFNELSALYCGEHLPELPVQYADYAVWQRDHLSGDRLDREVQWWKAAMTGAPPALKLPSDFARPLKESSRGGIFVTLLPRPLLEKLREFSRQESATVYMVLLAAYCVFLSRYSGQDDIVTGTDFSTRTNVETEGMIGFFINLLPVRVRLTGGPTFRSLIPRAKTAALDAFAHPDLPFEKLVEEIQPERVPSRHPIVQVLLVMQNIPRSRPRFTGLEVEEYDLPFNTSKFDLALFVEEKPDGLSARWVYHADLFRPETIGRMAKHFHVLLENALASPDVAVSTLEMLDHAEKLEQDWKGREAKQSKLSKLRSTAPLAISLTSN